MDKRQEIQVPSSIEPATSPIRSSHIPVYQPLSHSIKQTNIKISNGFNAEPQPSNSNPFQHNLIHHEPIKTECLQKHHSETVKESTSPPIAISSSTFAHQFSPSSLSRTSSMSERDHITESPLPMMPNFVRTTTLQSSARNVDNFSLIAKTNSMLASKSPPPPPLMELTAMTIPRNDEFTPRIGNLNYGYPQPEPSIATLEHQRIDHFRQSVSPQMLHFQQIEERMVDQLNELYKATMLIHSNQQETPQLERDEIDRTSQPYLQHEPVYNQGQYHL